MNKSDKLFSELLYLLHRNAFNALDKIDKANYSESDLTSVRQLIDMVVMLKEKTRGNLSDELDQIQTMMLSELELKYQTTFKINIK
tara:strand:+ start:442 stop:699 length:258 start_codon:yes stop_codon:yes gene_type:complete